MNESRKLQQHNRKWMITSLVLVICLVTYVFIYPPIHKNGETVAKVNGVSISKNQLYDKLVSGSGKQALQSMISEEVIRQEAEKSGVQVTDADMNTELGNVKSMFSSDEEFNQALVTYGMTLEGLKQDLKSQVQLRKLLEPQISVTDEQIKQYYTDNLESLKTPAQVRASHILVQTKEEAEAILAELKNGADFAVMAADKSLDTATKNTGGDLEYLAQGQKEEAFEAAAFALGTGELSNVVEASDGYHIIKVTDRKEASTPTLEEKQEDIRKQLVDNQVTDLSNTWLDQKISEANVTNYLNKAS